MRAAIVSLIVAPLALAVLPASAQTNPSSDQIIQSLKPSGNLLSGGTRGIRMANPNASEETPQASATGTAPATASTTTPATHPVAHPVAQAAHPTRTASAASAAAAEAPSVSLSVQFASGSADLTPQARQTLDQLGKALSSSDLAQYRFRIEGHTDTVGPVDLNKTLSQQRADSVAAYLQSKFGVSTNRLQTIGMGEDGLLVPTPPNTPNEKNRRVNVVNLGA
ncbi:MAG TPA: OmpA family protein [Acetobacteraceae bacterium]|jgi:OOP family OmpA-OmpF porin|nr:OmpA family protein [Acetobacteraceae bacterium]